MNDQDCMYSHTTGGANSYTPTGPARKLGVDRLRILGVLGLAGLVGV